MKHNILVLGASGLVGSAVVRALVEAGLGVRAFARNSAKISELFGSTVTGISGDVTNMADLGQALNGCTGVYVAVPWQIERQTIQALVKKLNEEGRKDVHVVYQSGNTVLQSNRWFSMIDEKACAEELLQKSKLPYTIFKTSWFMDALKRFINNGRATIFGKQALAHRFVALQDYAKMVAHAFQSNEARMKTVVVNGPEAISLPAALQTYCDIAQKGMRVAVTPIWIGRVLARLTRSRELGEAVDLMAYFEKVTQTADEMDKPHGLEEPSTKLREWAKMQAY